MFRHTKHVFLKASQGLGLASEAVDCLKLATIRAAADVVHYGIVEG